MKRVCPYASELTCKYPCCPNSGDNWNYQGPIDPNFDCQCICTVCKTDAEVADCAREI